jgi:hypothetical protein
MSNEEGPSNSCCVSPGGSMSVRYLLDLKSLLDGWQLVSRRLTSVVEGP